MVQKGWLDVPGPESEQAALFLSTYSVVAAAWAAVSGSRTPASRPADNSPDLMKLRTLRTLLKENLPLKRHGIYQSSQILSNFNCSGPGSQAMQFVAESAILWQPKPGARGLRRRDFCTCNPWRSAMRRR